MIVVYVSNECLSSLNLVNSIPADGDLHSDPYSCKSFSMTANAIRD